MSIALLFSPQGSQAVGMGRELAEASTAARAAYAAADAALGWSVSATCWSGPQERLDETRQTQPCLLATSVAALRALEEVALLPSARLAPAFVAGHSVGEYAALVAAGVLAFDDALRLVATRGELMAAQSETGAMAAVIGLERAAVAQVVEATARQTELVVANENAPGQIVISGERAAIDRVEPALRRAGARRIVPLPVSGAFHSPRMAPVTELLAEAFRSVAWHDADPPVVSNVTAEPLTDATTIRRLLAEQVRSPVEWVASVRCMRDAGVDLMIECGPGSALTGMVKRIAPEVRTANVADAESLAAAVELLDAVGVGASV